MMAAVCTFVGLLLAQSDVVEKPDPEHAALAIEAARAAREQEARALRTFLLTHDSKAAIESLKDVVKKDPSRVETYLRIAALAATSGDPELARKMIEAGAAHAPDPRESERLVERTHLLETPRPVSTEIPRVEGSSDVSSHTSENSTINLGPDATEATRILAQSESILSEALATISRAESADASVRVAAAKANAIRDAATEEDRRRVYEQSMNDGYAAIRLGRVPAAEDAFRTAADAGPKKADPVLQLLLIASRRKDESQALELLKRAAEIEAFQVEDLIQHPEARFLIQDEVLLDQIDLHFGHGVAVKMKELSRIVRLIEIIDRVQDEAIRSRLLTEVLSKARTEGLLAHASALISNKVR